MVKQTSKTPALRFPEFSGEWENKEIGKSIKLLSGYAFKGENIVSYQTPYPLLRGINIGEGKIRHSEEIDRYYNGKIEGLEKFRLSLGDIVLGMDGSKVGKNSALIDEKDIDAILIQRVAKIKAKENASTNFIYQHINSFHFHNYVDKVKTSSGIPHISADHIKGFKIFFPSLPEQEKIADFLGAVDEKIQQLTRKKELLEQYKKGVMQRIFSQEIRFKDDNGRDFPDWEEKRLGDVLEYEQPTKYLVDSTDYDNSYPTPVLTAGKTFILGYTNEQNGIYENGLPVIIFDDFTTATQFVDFPFKAKSSAMKILTANAGFNIKFAFEAMQLMKYEVGGHERHWISKFANIQIEFPTLPEQEKIADFLSAIDDKITLASNQLDAAKAFKKGLLQKMFV